MDHLLCDEINRRGKFIDTFFLDFPFRKEKDDNDDNEG